MLAMCATITWPSFIVARLRHPAPLVWPDRRTGLVLVLVFALAASLRLTMLGYAEFHEDEVEVVSLAARAIKGEGYAVFLHRKGPLQMLVPMANWLMAGRITEGSARLPFTVANLLGVLAVAWLAHRVAGRPAALAAGGVLAVNGYLVAFGRMVQYQSLVFLLASVAFVCLWQAARCGERRLILPGALCLAAGLLAHFDTLVFVPVMGYLAGLTWHRWPQARLTLSVGFGLAAAACLSFYVPYVLDPQFAHTADYLFENRVGSAWPYNNLGLLWSLDSVYASRFYQPLLVGLAGGGVLLELAATRKCGAWLLTTVGAGGTAIGAWWSNYLKVGKLSLAVVPWLMLTGGVMWVLRDREGGRRPGRRAVRHGREAVVLWWAIPALAYTFLVGDPRTHVYVMYPAAAVLAGIGAGAMWHWVGRLRPVMALVGTGVVALVVAYQVTIFLPTETGLAAMRTGWKDSLASRVYGRLPEAHSYFGYPSRSGWKAAGVLMAKGVLPDDFRSVGVEFSVPVWYSFETPRSCYEDAELYLVAVPIDVSAVVPQAIGSARYARVGTVVSEGLPRLELWQKGAPTAAPFLSDLADLAPVFDAMATPDRFGRLADDTIPVRYQFGALTELVGFRLSPTMDDWAVLPGSELSVRLTWLSLHPTETAYRAFVHLGENPVQAQQDEDPACRLPMPLWRPGQTAVGQFRLSIPATTPPGRYPLWVGLYDPATMRRLPVTDEGGQPAGDAVALTTITVRPSP